jgi:putative transposase
MSWPLANAGHGALGNPFKGDRPVNHKTISLQGLRIAAADTPGAERIEERDCQREPNAIDCVRMVHKSGNLLTKVAKSIQPAVKQDLREIWRAPDLKAAQSALDTFETKYGAKYSGAVACLTKDRNALLAFYDVPAEPWDHVRTTNPIESVFATVRHRTVRVKGALSQDTAKLMVFKLITAAARTWRKLKGENQLPKVIQGVTFRDGIEVSVPTSHSAA